MAQTIIQSTSHCEWCQGGGYVFAYSKDPGEPQAGAYTFRCACWAGKNKRSSIPIWNPKWINFYVPTYLDEKPTAVEVLTLKKNSKEYDRRVKIWGKDFIDSLIESAGKDTSNGSKQESSKICESKDLSPS